MIPLNMFQRNGVLLARVDRIRLPAPPQRLVEVDQVADAVFFDLDHRQFGVEQVALGVEFFEVGGVATAVAVAGDFQRPRQNLAPRLDALCLRGELVDAGKGALYFAEGVQRRGSITVSGLIALSGSDRNPRLDRKSVV